MKNNKNCPITGDKESVLIFEYDSPPQGEPKLFRSKIYKRQVWKYLPSNHFISFHKMNLDNIYEGAYLDANYESEDKMSQIFDKIISLPDNQSDNIGRFKGIYEFSKKWFTNRSKIKLLDIGSGTGVFPYIVKKNGWICVAIDPDKRSVNHLRNKVKVDALLGDFHKIKPIEKFNIVTLNKVLEHVEDPITMLSKTKEWLNDDGFVYIEVPDGEISSKFGKNREEFFIDHYHIFSIASVAIMANKSGYNIQNILRLNEPSGKFTIRAFLTKTK